MLSGVFAFTHSLQIAGENFYNQYARVYIFQSKALSTESLRLFIPSLFILISNVIKKEVIAIFFLEMVITFYSLFVYSKLLQIANFSKSVIFMSILLMFGFLQSINIPVGLVGMPLNLGFLFTGMYLVLKYNIIQANEKAKYSIYIFIYLIIASFHRIDITTYNLLFFILFTKLSLPTKSAIVFSLFSIYFGIRYYFNLGHTFDAGTSYIGVWSRNIATTVKLVFFYLNLFLFLPFLKSDSDKNIDSLYYKMTLIFLTYIIVSFILTNLSELKSIVIQVSLWIPILMNKLNDKVFERKDAAC